jgi:hypothetical protein
MERVNELLNKLDKLHADQTNAVNDLKSFRDGTSYYIEAANDYSKAAREVGAVMTELRLLVANR